MNVVYIGVENPLTISIPGIPDNKVRASATGLRRTRGSKYILTPSGGGREVIIRASGTLPDGQVVSSQSKFRVKGLPNPTCQIAGKTGSISLPKGAIGKQTVVAIFKDFDFDLPLSVLGYTLSAPGLPAIEVTGNKFNNDARGLINRVRSGGN